MFCSDRRHRLCFWFIRFIRLFSDHRNELSHLEHMNLASNFVISTLILNWIGISFLSGQPGLFLPQVQAFLKLQVQAFLKLQVQTFLKLQIQTFLKLQVQTLLKFPYKHFGIPQVCLPPLCWLLLFLSAKATKQKAAKLYNISTKNIHRSHHNTRTRTTVSEDSVWHSPTSQLCCVSLFSL